MTSAYPDRCFAFDQFGPLSIRPCHGACWARRKHPVRLRATYHRTHGIRYFHGCYCVGDDQLWGVTREHKGAVHTLAALKSIRASRPGGLPECRWMRVERVGEVVGQGICGGDGAGHPAGG